MLHNSIGYASAAMNFRSASNSISVFFSSDPIFAKLANGSTVSREPREPEVVSLPYSGARLDGCNVLLARRSGAPRTCWSNLQIWPTHDRTVTILAFERVN